MKDINGRIIKVSQPRVSQYDASQTVQVQSQSSSQMSKNDSEASRAIMKLKLNRSSKMLVQDQKQSVLSLYLSM